MKSKRICNHCNTESVICVEIDDKKSYLCVDEFLKLYYSEEKYMIIYPFTVKRRGKNEQFELAIKILEIFSFVKDEFGFQKTDKNIALIADQMSYMIKIFPELGKLDKSEIGKMILDKSYPQYENHIKAVETKQDLLGFITEAEKRNLRMLP